MRTWTCHAREHCTEIFGLQEEAFCWFVNEASIPPQALLRWRKGRHSPDCGMVRLQTRPIDVCLPVPFWNRPRAEHLLRYKQILITLCTKTQFCVGVMSTQMIFSLDLEKAIRVPVSGFEYLFEISFRISLSGTGKSIVRPPSPWTKFSLTALCFT